MPCSFAVCTQMHKNEYDMSLSHQVMSIKDTGSETSHAAQKLLYTTIRRGCEGLGVEIDRPEAVYDTIPSHMKHQQATTPPSSSSSSSTGSLHPPPPPPTPPSLPNTMSCQQTNTGYMKNHLISAVPDPRYFYWSLTIHHSIAHLVEHLEYSAHTEAILAKKTSPAMHETKTLMLRL